MQTSFTYNHYVQLDDIDFIPICDRMTLKAYTERFLGQPKCDNSFNTKRVVIDFIGGVVVLHSNIGSLELRTYVSLCRPTFYWRIFNAVRIELSTDNSATSGESLNLLSVLFASLSENLLAKINIVNRFLRLDSAKITNLIFSFNLFS